ncbi:MAG: hypothetical protein JWN70_7150 [Planctomycetaceae bacterium]|nr:hypothetical protein [Planctomycetaceae bacterium]
MPFGISQPQFANRQEALDLVSSLTRVTRDAGQSGREWEEVNEVRGGLRGFWHKNIVWREWRERALY